MRYLIVLVLGLVILSGCTEKRKSLTCYVNPFIGTANGGNTYPGAVVPFGMVQLSPDAGYSDVRDYIANRNGHQYNYGIKEIQGFSHLHLSGTANDPAGDISVLPMSGIQPSAAFIKSEISHEEEQASPGYYAVMLKSFRIKAELTTTLRCAFHRYTFPESKRAVIRFDLACQNGGKPVECYFKKLNDTTFIGNRFSAGYADDKRVYFAIRTSKPINDIILFADTNQVNSKIEVHAVTVKSSLVFRTKKNDQILMKVALSFAGIEGAIDGLKEIPDWNFDLVRQNAELSWEKELQKIRIHSDDEAFKTTFYTAVYHCYISSMRFDDARGVYRGADGRNHKESNIYSVFGLWDTYRALFPLFSITQADHVPNFINSFLSFYDQYGLLPVWEMSFCETHCMTGYHAIPVIADAILKNTGGFSYEKAYEAMRSSAFQDIRATREYREYGYVPHDKATASVTKTLEYAYDDWCIALVAKKLGKTEDFQLFMKRSAYWENLFDPAINFVRPKYSDGSWVPGFDPFTDRTNGKESFTEGNSWHYTFFVPQDVYGMIHKFGSKKKFMNKLDSLFVMPYPDGNYLGGMGGLIGQYAHGNQPSHHLPYLYHFLGKPFKTADLVKKIMNSFYSNKPDGITGNEDTGSMSAWYVWNAIGIYPFNPVSGEYLIGSPKAEKTEITLANGNQFVVIAQNLSNKNRYVQLAKLNGKPYNKSFINHKVISSGGKLELFMDDRPSDNWGTHEEDLPGKK